MARNVERTRQRTLRTESSVCDGMHHAQLLLACTVTTIKPTALRRRVWRKQGEKFELYNLIPSFGLGYKSISVWAAFSVNRRTPLIRLERNLNQTKYKQILQEQVILFAETYYDGIGSIIFQQSGCGTHRAKSVHTSLEARSIELLPCPLKVRT